MNFKKIVQFNKLREQLSVGELAVADAFRESSESDRTLIAEALQPQKSAGKKATKTERKVEHCIACDYPKRHKIHKDAVLVGYHEFQSSSLAPKKSQRAASLAEQVKGNLQRREPTVGGFADDTDHLRCTALSGTGNGEACGLVEDAVIHHDNSYGSYHAFVPPAQSAAASGD